MVLAVGVVVNGAEVQNEHVDANACSQKPKRKAHRPEGFRAGGHCRYPGHFQLSIIARAATIRSGVVKDKLWAYGDGVRVVRSARAFPA